jgi:serralysin
VTTSLKPLVYRPVGPSLGVGTVVRGPDVLVDALTWGTKWVNQRGGGVVIPVSIYSPVDANSGTYVPNAVEISAVQSVLESYSSFLNVSFSFDPLGGSVAHGIRFVIGKNGAAGELGFTQPPGQTSYNGVPYSDITIYRDNYVSGINSALTYGSVDFATYLHEFGHSLGLAHPHDNGGALGSPSSLFPGVMLAKGSRGDYDLNQGINTIMGYNNGWQTAPQGATPSTLYGNQASPMALDILTLQKIYGPNLTYHLGDDSYELVASNAVGTGYSCIWDAGGNDTIVGATQLSNVIDLRPATGAVAVGGGGYVSYAQGIHGGFTIAAGVIIESAVGGNLADVLVGNAADNHLTGGGGADLLQGGAGHDSFIYTQVSDSSLNQFDTILDFTENVDQLDFSLIDANVAVAGDQAFTFLGEAAAFTGAGQIRVVYSGVDTLVYANINSDVAAEFCLKLSGHHVLSGVDFIL